MSSKFKISSPKISIQKIYSKLKQEDLLVTNNPHIKKNILCKIYLNSNDIEKFLKKIPFSKEPHFAYIARKGSRFDGHNLAEKILNSGNIFIGNPIYIHEIEENEKKKSIWTKKIISHSHFIGVNNTEKSINILIESAFNIDKNKFITIGVTGTNGKTSVTQICSQIIETLSSEKVLRIGTLGMQIGSENIPGSHVTTPDYPSLLHIIKAIDKNNINKVVMETTSHGLKENRLGNWKIDIAVFTNLTQDHLDYHKTMEDYQVSKEKLFSHYLKDNGTAVICTNNDKWLSFAKKAQNKNRKLIGIGESSFAHAFLNEFSILFEKVSYLSVDDKKSTLNGISGKIKLQDKHGVICEEELICPLIGEFQYDNTLCSIACALGLNYSLSKIAPILKNIKNIPGRLEIVKIDNKLITNKLPTVLIDYAHSPDALEKAILICKNILKSENKGKLITVFGCGGDRDKSKRAAMGKIASELSDIAIVTSDNPRTENPDEIINNIYSGIKENSKCFKTKDRKKAIKLAISKGNEFDLILVAGKGHEDYQIIGDTKHPFSDSQVARSLLLKENK